MLVLFFVEVSLSVGIRCGAPYGGNIQARASLSAGRYGVKDDVKVTDLNSASIVTDLFQLSEFFSLLL